MAQRKAMLLPAKINALLDRQRLALAQEAARIYAETQSLRKTATQLHVSHETIRKLIAEAEAA